MILPMKLKQHQYILKPTLLISYLSPATEDYEFDGKTSLILRLDISVKTPNHLCMQPLLQVQTTFSRMCCRDADV